MDLEGDSMPLPKKAILGILTDNVSLRSSVLPLSRRVATEWADGLDIPRGGETVLYTGHMYQLIPFIAAMANQMKALENSWITRLMDYGRLVNKFINISSFMGRAKKEERQAHNRSLRSIALLLRESGVQFGYLYEDELYSGALLHDQGIDKDFISHARVVQKMFAAHGVKKAITVDPHTTNMLRHVYPEVLDGFDIEVQSYLEVLAEQNLEVKKHLEGQVMVHDSCVYARYEEIIEQPRSLLEKAGLTVESPELSGSLTHCCGGPIESLFPARAHEIATKRAEQLMTAGCQVATMCPICLVNLKSAANGKGIIFRDIANILAEAFLDGSRSPGDTHNPLT
jgi:Fe-S oxidoreductase